MKQETAEYPVMLIIDMVKDNFDTKKNMPITQQALKIIEPINQCITEFRKNNWPIVFSTDSFHEDDFIFHSKMHPHSLEGTEGAEVIDELDRLPEDLWLPKPRFSAFFKTGLEKWLQERNITLCAVGGIATNYCVLTTVMDAICHDFKAVFLEDCSAAFNEQTHEQTLALYRKSPLFPLLRVLNYNELIQELA